MAVNPEPECWNCRHFLDEGLRKVCRLHEVVLPMERGPHLICSRWQHRADSQRSVVWWHRRFLRYDSLLYRYSPFGAEPPRPAAPFRALPPASP
jgi:hypothetical protein